MTGRYRGEPLIEFGGTVIADGSFDLDALPEGPMRITLRWARFQGEGNGAYDDQEVETVTSFPATYAMRIYQPPPDEAFFDPPWSTEGRIAAAVPLLYIDENENQLWDEWEQIVGGPIDIVVVWNEDKPSFDLFDSGIAFDSGFLLGFDTASGEAFGFRLMYASIDYCAGADSTRPDEFFPSFDDTLDLVVGRPWDDLVAWDCQLG